VRRRGSHIGQAIGWAVPGNGVLNVFFTDSVSELYGRRLYWTETADKIMRLVPVKTVKTL
jgi:hypothetical protein